MLREINFFKDRQIQQESELTEVAKVLNYENFKKGSNVFEWGSFGDKFYIILRGRVSVLVPQEKLKKKVNTLVKEEMLKMYVKQATNKKSS